MHCDSLVPCVARLEQAGGNVLQVREYSKLEPVNIHADPAFLKVSRLPLLLHSLQNSS